MDVARSARLTASVLEGVLALAIVMVVVFGVLRPAIGPAGLGLGSGPVFGRMPTVDTTLDLESVTVTTDPALSTLEGRTVEPGDGVEFAVPTGTEVAVFGPDLRQRLAFVATPVVGGLLAVGVLWLLLRVTHTLRRGDPFVAANARRLYLIAALVGIGGQATALLATWGELGILRHPDVAPYVLVDTSTTIVPLFAGLGVAVAAEVFRQGTLLRADVEGLV
jgi:hypothetical protein